MVLRTIIAKTMIVRTNAKLSKYKTLNVHNSQNFRKENITTLLLQIRELRCCRLGDVLKLTEHINREASQQSNCSGVRGQD